MWRGQWSSTLAKSFWFQCSAASLNTVEADRGLRSLPAPPSPSLSQRRDQKGQKEEAKVPGKLLHPLVPADMLNVDTG